MSIAWIVETLLNEGSYLEKPNLEVRSELTGRLHKSVPITVKHVVENCDQDVCFELD